MLKLIRESISQEALNFMRDKKDFFDDLVAIIKEIHADKDVKKLRRSEGWSGAGYKLKIIECIEKHTGIVIEDIEEGHPAIYPPELTANHPFLIGWRGDILNSFSDEHWFNDSESVTKVMNKFKKDSLYADIDVVNGKVGGAFKEMKLIMMLPAQHMVSPHIFFPQEMAAIILHEVGHAYTFMLCVARSVTTNLVLSGMARMYEGSISPAKRHYVFERYSKDRKASKDRLDAMKKCKNAEELAVIILNDDIEECKSELGASLYDVSSCEQIADEYSTRCGAGAYLAKALHKFYFFGWQTDFGRYWVYIAKTILFIIRVIIAAAGGIFALIGIAFTLWGLVFGPDKRDEIYDNPYARLNRIKNQIIDQLKREDLSKAEKAQKVKDVETIEDLQKSYSDGVRLDETIAYVFRGSWRDAHNFEMMQKDLENLANNRLFTGAAKLGIV